MKKTLLFTFLCFSTTILSQTYGLVFDNSFGTNGTVYNAGINFSPTKGQLINGNYYFVSTDKIVKAQYNGVIDTTFGSNGFISFSDAINTCEILGFKSINNSIYIYGSITSSSDRDVFICKINELGNYDLNFGTNGISRINLGGNESLNDFCLDPSGNLYCIGTRNQTGMDDTYKRMIYYKISQNGSLNTAFDSNGYKTFLLNQFTEGASIIPMQDKFILIGTSSIVIGGINQKLLQVKVDNSGNLESTFGENGSISTSLGGGSIAIHDVVVANGTMYISYFYAWSFATQGSKIFKYNLITNQEVYTVGTYYNSYAQLQNSNTVYITGGYRCNFPCRRDFLLTRLLSNGTVDPSFGANGNFNYSLDINADNFSTVVIPDSNGNILVAGWINKYYENGFAMIRLYESLLGTDDHVLSNSTVYPNPLKGDMLTLSTVTSGSYRVLNTLGQEMSKGTIDNGTLSAANLTPGVYLLEITTNGQTSVKRFIKQ